MLTPKQAEELRRLYDAAMLEDVTARIEGTVDDHTWPRWLELYHVASEMDDIKYIRNGWPGVMPRVKELLEEFDAAYPTTS